MKFCKCAHQREISVLILNFLLFTNTFRSYFMACINDRLDYMSMCGMSRGFAAQ